MAIMDFLWMTKAKLFLLIIFLIVTIPKYYNSNCDAACASGAASPLCQCGFSIANFYTIFVLAYIVACIMGEIYKIIKKRTGKKIAA
ncbi:Uncharacterised protein [uncultured archaeon]|nr:Uncharacterised protein [uncultured archaeon]